MRPIPALGFAQPGYMEPAARDCFVSGHFDDPEAYRHFAQITVAELDHSRGTGGNHAFYYPFPLPTLPASWPAPVGCRSRQQRQGREWRRVIIGPSVTTSSPRKSSPMSSPRS